MIARRWLGWIAELFPRNVRDVLGDEIDDALAVQQLQGRAVVIETFALLGAVAVAWHGFLRTAEGVRRMLFVSSLAWFGFLLMVENIRFLPSVADSNVGAPALVGSLLLAGAFVSVAKSQLVALTLAIGGIITSSYAAASADWWEPGESMFGQLLAGSATLLLIPFVFAVVARYGLTIRWPTIAISALPGIVALFGDYLAAIDAEAALAIAFLGPWVHPAVAALTLPVLVHEVLVYRDTPFVLLALYMVGVLWVRTLGRHAVRKLLTVTLLEIVRRFSITDVGFARPRTEED